MSSVNEKESFRIIAREARKDIAIEDRTIADTAIINTLLATKAYEKASTVFAYVAFDGEVETIDFITRAIKDGKTVCLPRVEGVDMVFCKVRSISDLEIGNYGIMEPKNECEQVKHADLVVVPGVAFDEQRHRIGFGGGYYDRLLAGQKTCAIAIAYEIQIFDSVPHTDRDVPMSMIITEERVF